MLTAYACMRYAGVKVVKVNMSEFVSSCESLFLNRVSSVYKNGEAIVPDENYPALIFFKIAAPDISEKLDAV